MINGTRSQTDLRNNNMRFQQRSPTPDIIQSFQPGSSQSNKNFLNNIGQGYNPQPFNPGDLRPISHQSGSDMYQNSPGNFNQMNNQLQNAPFHPDQLSQSVYGGGMAVDMSQSGLLQSQMNGFGRTNNNRFGFFDQYPQSEERYEEILFRMSGFIKNYSRDRKVQNDTFFKQFDAYESRTFQTWELVSMFEITFPQARIIVKKFDPTFIAKVQLKDLLQELSNQIQLNIIDFSNINVSEYQKKPIPYLRELKKLAIHLKDPSEGSLGKQSHSYFEVFLQISKINSQNGSSPYWVPNKVFQDYLMQKCGKILNFEQVEQLISYIQIQSLPEKEKDRISIVQFVSAMRQIEIDFQTYDFKELLDDLGKLSKQEKQNKDIDFDLIKSKIQRIKEIFSQEKLQKEFYKSLSEKYDIKYKNAKNNNQETTTIGIKETTLLRYLEQQFSNFSIKERESISKYYRIDILIGEPVPIPNEVSQVTQFDQSLAPSVSNDLKNSAEQQSKTLIGQQIKQLVNDPSSESLNRLSGTESAGQLPKPIVVSKFQNRQVENQQNDQDDIDVRDDIEEVDEDIDYEERNQIDVDDVDEDKKEGGQQEKKKVFWIDFKRFEKDVKPTFQNQDKTYSLKMILKFEVLEAIKGWKILTGESLIEKFRVEDRKCTFFANRIQVTKLLSRVLAPQKVQEDMVESVINFFTTVNDKGSKCIDYKQFYNFFYQYCKTSIYKDNQITLFNALSEMYKKEQEHKQKLKSLGAQMNIRNLKQSRTDSIEVDSQLFFNYLNNEVKRLKITFKSEEKNKIEQILKIENSNKINLRKFQELIGFEEEQDINNAVTNQSSFRQICIRLQFNQHSVATIRQNLQKITNAISFFNNMWSFLALDNNNNNDQLFVTLGQQMRLCLNKDNINNKKFFALLEFEMNKLIILERFFIQMKAKTRYGQTPLELSDVLEAYGGDFNLKEISRSNFISMLRQWQLVGESEDNQELTYFLDEYDLSEENSFVNFKILEEDFDEIIGPIGSNESVLEKLSEKVIRTVISPQVSGFIMANQQFQQGSGDLMATIRQIQDFNRSKNNLSELDYQNSNTTYSTEWIHSFDLVQWLRNQMIIISNSDPEIVQIFVDYISVHENSKKNMISIPNFIRKILEIDSNLNRQGLIIEVSLKQAKKLQIHLAQMLYYLKKTPNTFFQGSQMVKDEDFEEMITAKELCIENIELSSSIYDIIQALKDGAPYISIDFFNDQLNTMIREHERKIDFFKIMSRKLLQKGVTIENAIKLVKGDINISMGCGVTINDLKTICKAYNIVADEQQTLQPLLQTFYLNDQGEVNIDDFVYQFNSAFSRQQPGLHTKQKDIFQKQIQIKAERYCDNIDHILDKIADVIMVEHLFEFGSLLKGFDFFNNNQISNADFFNLLEQVFIDKIGRGDILDLIELFDKEKSGHVDIILIADQLNSRLRTCPIILKSQVSEIIGQRIIEPITPQKQLQKSTRPPEFSFIFLDLISALIKRKQGTLFEWLTHFGRQQEGYLSFIEFKAAFDKMDCSKTQGKTQIVFDYLKQIQDHDLAHSMLSIQEICDEVQKDFTDQSVDSIAFEILKIAAPHLENNHIPIRDSCKKFETTKGSGEILYSDFTYTLLQNELQLKEVLSQNMLECLEFKFNQNHAQNIPYEPLIQILISIEEQLKLKLIITQQDIDEYHQTAHSFTSKIQAPAKQEPSFVVRSKKNTYFEPLGFTSVQLEDNSHIKFCDDILKATRALGASVELYFQNYGTISNWDGIRYLDTNDFREALIQLKLSWAENPDQVKQFYKAIDQATIDSTNIKKHGLSLETIGSIIFSNSKTNLLHEEADVLYQVHKHIVNLGLIQSVPEIFNFINFERDGTTTLADFKKLLLDSFKLRGKIPEIELGVFFQRYRIEGSPYSRQIVSSYNFMQDLAYQHIGIGLINQHGARHTENIVKQIQTKMMIETSSHGLQDDEVQSEIRSFFIRSSMQGGQIQFMYGDLVRIFQSLNLVSENYDSSHEIIDNYYKLCSKIDTQSKKIAPVYVENIELPSFVDFNAFVDAVIILAQKPLTGLYQDTLDLVYMSSKKRNISISGPYLMFLFQEADLQKQGQVTLEVFLEKVQKKILFNEKDLPLSDIAFLATRYLQNQMLQSGEQQHLVSYERFLNDYYEHEKGRLGECFKLLLAAGNKKKQAEILKVLGSNSNSARAKQRELTDLSEEDQKIFISMGKHLKKNSLEDSLVGYLIRADESKCGFLSRKQIKDSCFAIQVKLSEKQIDQLTKSLSKDSQFRYSYLDLINFLISHRYMLLVQRENNIFYEEEDQLGVGIDIKKLQISQQLKGNLELKCPRIIEEANKIQFDGKKINDTQLFQIFRICEISVESKDLLTLQQYLQVSRDKETHEINISQLLQHFQINTQPSKLLQNIQKQLKELKVNIGQMLSSQIYLTFGDFKNCLMKAKVELPKDNETLKQLFNLISENKDELLNQTLQQVLEFKLISEKQEKKIEKLMNPPPNYVQQMIKFVVSQKIDLMVQFKNSQQTKRIAAQDLMKFLDSKKFFLNQQDKYNLINFFKLQDGLLDFSKIIKYIQQDNPNYGVANVYSEKNKLLDAQSKALQIQLTKQNFSQIPRNIKQILFNITQILRDRQITIEKLLTEMDANQDGKIQMEELDQFCIKNELTLGMPKQSTKLLFNYLDTDRNGVLSLKELGVLLENTNYVFSERMASTFSQDFELKLKSEIISLFEKIDIDRNGKLTADELFVMLKQQPQSFENLSLEKAKDLIRQISNGQDKISQEDFVNYVLPKQKEQLLNMNDSMEDLRLIFFQFANKIGKLNEQVLDKKQLKQLIQSTGYSTITDKEIQILFEEIDKNQNGFIDVDEFMAYMYLGDKIQTPSRDILLNIRKAHYKINVNSVFDMVRTMKNSQCISFTQKLIESSKTHTPSSSIRPNYDMQSMKYRDLDKSNDFMKALNVQKLNNLDEFIGNYKPNYSLEFNIIEIVGVPNVNTNQDVYSNHHLEVRFFLYDTKRKFIQSSILISSAELIQPKAIKEPIYSSAWQISNDQKTICLRGSEDWQLVVELVSIDLTDKSKQIAVGWAALSLKELQSKDQEKLLLKGGSPFNNEPYQEIITEENKIQPKKGGFFSALQRAVIPKVDRHIKLELKNFDKMNVQTKANLSLLPENTLCYKNLLTFISAFRVYSYKHLIKDQTTMQKPKPDLIISHFDKIYDCPDTQLVLCQNWLKISVVEVKTCENLTANIETMRKLIQRIYGLHHDPSFQYDAIYPTRSTTGQIHLDRLDELKRCILQENPTLLQNLPQKRVKQEEIVFIEEYQPLTGQDYDLNSQLGLNLDNQKLQDELEKILAFGE